MKNQFDRMLRDALSAEERKLWDDLVEPSPLQMVSDMFRTRTRWLMAGGLIAGFVFMGLGVVALLRFWEAAETLAAIRWGMGFIMCVWGLWAVKVWSWMEIQRNALTREIKRLELQVVHLGAELRGEPTE